MELALQPRLKDAHTKSLQKMLADGIEGGTTAAGYTTELLQVVKTAHVPRAYLRKPTLGAKASDAFSWLVKRVRHPANQRHLTKATKVLVAVDVALLAHEVAAAGFLMNAMATDDAECRLDAMLNALRKYPGDRDPALIAAMDLVEDDFDRIHDGWREIGLAIAQNVDKIAFKTATVAIVLQSAALHGYALPLLLGIEGVHAICEHDSVMRRAALAANLQYMMQPEYYRQVMAIRDGSIADDEGVTDFLALDQCYRYSQVAFAGWINDGLHVWVGELTAWFSSNTRNWQDYYSDLADDTRRDAEESVVRWRGLGWGYQAEAAPVGDADGEYVWVPPGEFMMGSEDGIDDEKPVHKVRITRGFWIGKHEVTNAQYATFLNAYGRDEDKDGNALVDIEEGDFEIEQRKGRFVPKQGRDEYPVVAVTWYGATAYCDHYGLDLPTEAQWEYAAHGPEGRRYPWGNDWDAENCCNVDNKGPDGRAFPVGSFPAGASWCGALDMAGNVWEWCADWYGGDYYAKSPTTDPTGPPSGLLRVWRGGTWGYNVHYCLSASRGSESPDNAYHFSGFRAARTQ